MEHNSYIAISHMQRIGKKPVLAIMSADGKIYSFRQLQWENKRLLPKRSNWKGYYRYYPESQPFQLFGRNNKRMDKGT